MVEKQTLMNLEPQPRPHSLMPVTSDVSGDTHNRALSASTPWLGRDLAVHVLTTLEEGLRKQERRKQGDPIHPVKVDVLLNQERLRLEGQAHAAQSMMTQLVYGVLRHWVLLNALLAMQSNIPLSKLYSEVLTLLRVGLYSMLEMDSVPAYAAIDGVVRQAKGLIQSGKRTIPPAEAKALGDYVNGVLRHLQRKLPEQLPAGELRSSAIALLASSEQESARLNLPEWLIERLKRQYDMQTLEQMAIEHRKPAVITLRVNTLLVSVHAFCEALQQQHVAYIQPEPETIPELLVMENLSVPIPQLPGYAQGWFMVQNLHAAKVSVLLDPQPDWQVVDLCAAPGGKTTHLAALMGGKGHINAVDPSKSRCVTLQENLQRLQIPETMVSVHQVSAANFKPAHTQAVDAVLIDAPCSGLGTLRHHPEIAFQLTSDALCKTLATQADILKHGAQWVKPGGVLLYSTCSIDRTENQEQIQQFLCDHADFVLEQEQLFLPTATGDGFYMARLIRQ